MASCRLASEEGWLIDETHPWGLPLRMEGLCTKRTLLPAQETNSLKRRVVQTPQIGHGT